MSAFRAGKPATDELYDRAMKAAVRRAALQVAWSIASWRQPLALSGPPDGDELSINHGAPFLAEGQGVRILRPVRGGDPEPVGLLAVTHVFDQWSRCRIEGGEPAALRNMLRARSGRTSRWSAPPCRPATTGSLRSAGLGTGGGIPGGSHESVRTFTVIGEVARSVPFC
jgi:hypothetical protein